MKKINLFSLIGSLLILAIALSACVPPTGPGTEPPLYPDEPPEAKEMARFASGEALLEAFEDASDRHWYGGADDFALRTTAVAESAPAGDGGAAKNDYSETNIQVEGVDEADIIKTDGDYLYLVSGSNLYIVYAYPAEEAEIVATIHYEDFHPSELFIDHDRLLVFGRAYYEYINEASPREEAGEQMIAPDIYPYYRASFMSARLYDIEDKADPVLLKAADFEGNYLTSRKIGDYAYFVVNNYPRWYPEPLACDGIVPLYRESAAVAEEAGLDEFAPSVTCTDIGYIPPLQASNFITLASMDLDDGEVQKEVIVGSGQNVYASQSSLYIAQTSWPRYTDVGELLEESREETVVTKFALYKGDILYQGKGEVPGHILNQFSMDEHEDHFRIATTTGQIWNSDEPSTNNVYVLDEDMELVGALEDLAPGEKIYSVRFMGDRGYVVTFKKVDPFFVIDLADPADPTVLGKLKIPGYSDYLHPYDETHIIGIGKDTVEAEEDLGDQRNLDFAWYQGVKMAIFDVSDVENPIELHKVVIGDRGTDSPVLHNHKAFLFHRERNLLVLPITLAEIQGEKSYDNQYGEFVFQGAFVYHVDLEDGFVERGRVTHYDDDEEFLKSGYYFYGSRGIERSLFIEDVLYTLSPALLQMNDLDSLERINRIELDDEDDRGPVFY